MSTLWAPLEVVDFGAADAFYGGVLGLTTVDTWERDGERGAVYSGGDGGLVEIVRPARRSFPPPRALQFATWADVDAAYARVPKAEGAPEIFPRGHYGFVAVDPEGHRMLIWSEKP
ncbi:VOC family protein [Hamadaea tsunoensis]|uniref:VOC family protein n=1 Tax=Hamadaea tsunoensis TaxID=53368 RepID=UPI0004214BA8|nr:VOC family protein [Hamadaea tsunoensis]